MMRATQGDPSAYDWLKAHTVELAFILVVVAWLAYVVRLSREFSFWSDDLRIIEQAGSWGGMLKPYDGALTLPTMLLDRGSVEVNGLTYSPFAIIGALCIVAVPLSYFFTARRQLGAPLAAVLAMPLVWFYGTNLREAGLNHYCALVGAVFCAAGLDRGRRADRVIFAGLVLSLVSSGAGLVIAVACVVHNAIVRPGLRRWLAVLVPTALYGGWWVAYSPPTSASDGLSLSRKVAIVRDFFLAPFHQAAFNSWPFAAVLVVAFCLWGALQLRQGLVAGANFIAWTIALVGWSVGLIQSRGLGATPSTFRYAYLSLGFAVLAVVPRKPIRWPDQFSATNPRWLAAAAIAVVLFGGARAVESSGALQRFSHDQTRLGRKAEGTLLVVRLGPRVIPDGRPLTFFGFGTPHGTAGEVRRLIARYGSPLRATVANIDQQLVDLRIAESQLGSHRNGVVCQPLTEPVTLASTSIGELELGRPNGGVASSPGPLRYRLWTKNALTIDVRRFGDHWVRLTRVPPGRYVYLTLPVLASDQPWSIRADGGCLSR